MLNNQVNNKNKKIMENIQNARSHDWRWYTYLVFAFIFAIFLVGGAYYGIFIDYWYVSFTVDKAELLNFDFLMSFLSVQVNLITIIWMFFLVFKRSKNNSIATIWYRAVINMNLLMFTIFWAGIFIELMEDFSVLSEYAPSQIICTIMTHFICPLFLLVMYCFEKNKQKLRYSKLFISWDFLIFCIYLIFYISFVFIRANIYDGIQSIPMLWKSYLKWPYFFINFDEPMIGDSWVLYLVMVVITFLIWAVVNELIIITINNISFKIQQKNKPKVGLF